MQTFYHGTSVLFPKFDLSHALEGDGKVKFGYGVYVTSHYRSAAHYAGANPAATQYYVYTVEIPDIKDDNYIAFKEVVNPAIVELAEQKLGESIGRSSPRTARTSVSSLRRNSTGKWTWKARRRLRPSCWISVWTSSFGHITGRTLRWAPTGLSSTTARSSSNALTRCCSTTRNN